MTQTTPILDPPRSSLGLSETAGFEQAFQATQRHRSQQRTAPLIAQWEVLITLFKHSFDIPILLGVQGAPTQEQHRTVLTGLMSMGEVVWTNTKGDETSLLESGYDHDFVLSNLKFLRAKYHEWYGNADPHIVAQDAKTICDALPKVAG